MNKKILIIILSFFLLTGCSTGSPSSDSFSASLKKASTTPYGKYPEKITYNLAQMTGDNNSNMPKGDTYDNNAYTRYLLKKLNVQNKDVLRAPDELYFNKINNIILSKDLPDIMIVDEALSVGDKGFAQKCISKMKELRNQGKTIVFISHNLKQVRDFCDSAMWIEGGMLKEYGPIDEVCDHYAEYVDYYNSLDAKEKKKEREKKFEKRMIAHSKMTLGDKFFAAIRTR